MDDARFDEWIARTSARLVLYAAMLAATLAGQAIGIGVDAALGVRALLVPVAFSTALEAFAGARVGASRAGRALTPRECMRISVTYSVGFVIVTLPLATWTLIASRTAAAREGGAGAGASSWTVSDVCLFLAAAVLATFARAALMRLFSARPRRP